VFSTIHTNDAATTLPRLLDMKVEPYLIASTVNLAIGQRLLRRLCNACKVEKKITAIEAKNLMEFIPKELVSTTHSMYVSHGCEACNNTGYKGRVGIYEVLVVTNAVRDAILRHASSNDLRDIAIKEGMVPIVVDGFKKALLGETTVEEVLRMRYE
jgi:type II secretory ATPase GspE/PulE/Tfp pilus assembly ATPase PilB-like protein